MPQAILLQDHEQLGSRGTFVDVSKGYLRNYLIPRKLAEPATKGAIAAAARALQASERAAAPPAAPPEGGGRAAARANRRPQASAAVPSPTVPTIPHQAGDDGRLF